MSLLTVCIASAVGTPIPLVRSQRTFAAIAAGEMHPVRWQVWTASYFETATSFDNMFFTGCRQTVIRNQLSADKLLERRLQRFLRERTRKEHDEYETV